MTQAPTPGTLSSDASRIYRETSDASGRLAPTAPVEASGSERWTEDMERERREADYERGFRDGQNNRPQPSGFIATLTDDQRAEILEYTGDDTHPQPSGETREAVARIVADHVAGGFDAALQDKQEWKDRSGLGYDCEPSDVNGPFKDDYLDAADAILAALSTTPARAEAQDEGAAGEIEFPYQRTFNAIADAVSFTWAGDSGKPSTFNISVEAFQRSYNNGRDAHPSPTPAADAERVGEAIADVISHESDWRTALTAMDAAEETPEDGSGKPGYWLHQIKVLDRILAALKSEGK